MSVKPILFNTEMVRAILDGRKTVARRVCKDGNDYVVPDMSFYDANRRTYAVHNYADRGHTDQLSIAERTCPICPGDILYVRETYCWCPCWDCGMDTEEGCCDKTARKFYNKDRKEYGCYGYKASFDDSEQPFDRWRPSIHMPKEAARIWLRVTGVRVERLQEMTVDEAEKEGFREKLTESKFMKSPLLQFSELWDTTINKQDLDTYGWNANPWVWVIEFERTVKPECI